jgi:hypothetical protein
MLLWASHAAHKNWIWTRGLLLIASAWAGSKFILLSLAMIRWYQTGIEVDLSTLSHPSWHTLYLGLSYSLDGSMNEFGIRWDDNWIYNEVTRLAPNVSLHSAEYTRQVRKWFLEAVLNHPLLAIEVLGLKVVGAVRIFWHEFIIGFLMAQALVARIRRPKREDQLLIGSLVGSILPLLVAVPIPQYLGFALPLFHTLIVVALLSLILNVRFLISSKAART